MSLKNKPSCPRCDLAGGILESEAGDRAERWITWDTTEVGVGGETAGSQLSNVLPTKSVFLHKECQKQKQKENLKCPTKPPDS